MDTQVNSTGAAIAAIILDDELFVSELNLRNPENGVPRILFSECYMRMEIPSIAERGWHTLEQINSFRMELSKDPKYSFVKPLTEEEYNAPRFIEDVKLPEFHEINS